MLFRRPEVWMLTTVFAIAGLLLAFGHIAEEVLEGDATKFDQTILFFFRSAPANILSAKQLMGGHQTHGCIASSYASRHPQFVIRAGTTAPVS